MDSANCLTESSQCVSCKIGEGFHREFKRWNRNLNNITLFTSPCISFSFQNIAVSVQKMKKIWIKRLFNRWMQWWSISSMEIRSHIKTLWRTGKFSMKLYPIASTKFIYSNYITSDTLQSERSEMLDADWNMNNIYETKICGWPQEASMNEMAHDAAKLDVLCNTAI